VHEPDEQVFAPSQGQRLDGSAWAPFSRTRDWSLYRTYQEQLGKPRTCGRRSWALAAPFIKANFNPDEPRIPAGQPGGGEHGVGAVAVAPLEVVAVHAMLGLEVSDDRLDRGAALHLATDRLGHPADLAGTRRHPRRARLGLIEAPYEELGQGLRTEFVSSEGCRHRQWERLVLWVLTVFFHPRAECVPRSTTRKIDRSLAIVVEALENLNRANFPLKSKARNFDGSMVGFRRYKKDFALGNQRITIAQNHRVGVRGWDTAG
jgi:hypothetical protein